MSKSLEFEYWLRSTLPKELGLSEAKKAAVNSVLYHFADYIRPLEAKAPKEFESFFDELKKAISRAGKKRKPKYHIIRDGQYEPLHKDVIALVEADRKRRNKR